MLDHPELMADQPRTADASSDPTDVRFSIRSLLIATFVVAVLAAGLGPYFRSIPPAERSQVGVLWGACLTFVAVWTGFYARMRYRLERAAGKKLLALPARGKYFGRATRWAVLLGGNLAIGIGLLQLLSAAHLIHIQQNVSSQNSMLFISIAWRTVFSALIMAIGMTTIWWSKAMQLREHGVLYGLRFLRWDHATDCRWSRWTDLLFFEGVDQRHNDVRFGMTVSAGQRERVGAILSDKLAALFHSQQTQLLSPTTRVVSPFPLISGREIASRGCLVFLIAWIVAILFAGHAYRAQTQEFSYGCYLGALAGVATAFVHTRRTGRAGPPRIRLTMPLHWPILLGWLAIAAACYYTGYLLASNAAWLTGVFGLGCGWALFSAIGVVSLDKLDLCDHGVVLRRWRFWPWHATRVRQLGLDGRRVSFRSGLTHVVAIVPQERREEVDALLKEKLGK